MAKNKKQPKQCAKPSPGAFAMLKGTEEETERWCVVTVMPDGTTYSIAEIDNGVPGDTLETEEANARLLSASKAMLDCIRMFLNGDARAAFVGRECIYLATGENPKRG